MGTTASTVASSAISVRLIGRFDVVVREEPIVMPHSAQRLVAFLALSDRPLQRPYVAGTLWLDASDARAAASLRTALWRIGECGHRLVDAGATTLGLAREVSVDVREVDRLARGLVQGTVGVFDFDAAALEHDVLPDWYDEWVIVERERFRQRRLHALEVVCDRLVAEGRYPEAIEAGLAAVRAEPLRESAHRALVKAHLAEGNRSEALRSYELYRQLLRREMGVDPSPQMDDLVRGLNPDGSRVSRRGNGPATG